MLPVAPPPLPPLSPADVLALIAGYDPWTLARWWAALANARWPDATFPVPKPADFDQREDKLTLTAVCFDTLSALVTPEEASRAYWVEELGLKTIAEWEVWWDAAEAAKAPGVESL